MHYACGLRNAPALQYLLSAAVDPLHTDAHGHTALQWARRFGFNEGERLIARATGAPLISTPPHQAVPCGNRGGESLPFAGSVGVASGLPGAQTTHPAQTVPSMSPLANGLASALPPSGIPFPPHNSVHSVASLGPHDAFPRAVSRAAAAADE